MFQKITAKSGAQSSQHPYPKEFSNFKVTTNGNNTKIQWETPTYNAGGSVSAVKHLLIRIRYDNAILYMGRNAIH